MRIDWADFSMDDTWESSRLGTVAYKLWTHPLVNGFIAQFPDWPLSFNSGKLFHIKQFGTFVKSPSTLTPREIGALRKEVHNYKSLQGRSKFGIKFAFLLIEKWA